jgi:hypothetical protein
VAIITTTTTGTTSTTTAGQAGAGVGTIGSARTTTTLTTSVAGEFYEDEDKNFHVMAEGFTAKQLSSLTAIDAQLQSGIQGQDQAHANTIDSNDCEAANPLFELRQYQYWRRQQHVHLASRGWTTVKNDPIVGTKGQPQSVCGPICRLYRIPDCQSMYTTRCALDDDFFALDPKSGVGCFSDVNNCYCVVLTASYTISSFCDEEVQNLEQFIIWNMS